ncbi:MAG TPA: NAD(P)-binding domain-containing protein [Usitatibacter sp.]|nr:NAD(P)-binding domain-containing protein [Usitatibacter sp.]
MIVGVPREVKDGEHRVGLGVQGVRDLAGRGHEIRIERGAGAGIGIADEAYAAAGARLVDAAAAWQSELVVKVKELQESELATLPEGRVVFGFQHLPGEPQRTRALAARGTTAIAFEMVRDERGDFPLLAPMSVIAGRMAIDVARAILPAPPRRVLVLGAGHAGLAAARAAVASGAEVVVLTRSGASIMAARREGLAADAATATNIEAAALRADLIVGAVFVPAARTPKLLPRSLVRRMRRGAMIVDISIDAGGVAETSRPTTHADPTYVDEGVVHYCVANMPAARPRESAAALWDASLPFVRRMCERGIAHAVRDNGALRCGVLTWRGRVVHEGLAHEAGLAFTPLGPEDLR